MKPLLPILLTLLAIGVGVVVVRCWPYWRGKLNDEYLHMRMDTAKKVARELASDISAESRFNGVQIHVWSKDGVLIVFEGIVPSSNDLVDLKSLVEKGRGSTPAKWNVNVSTNSE